MAKLFVEMLALVSAVSAVYWNHDQCRLYIDRETTIVLENIKSRTTKTIERLTHSSYYKLHDNRVEVFGTYDNQKVMEIELLTATEAENCPYKVYSKRNLSPACTSYTGCNECVMAYNCKWSSLGCADGMDSRYWFEKLLTCKNDFHTIQPSRCPEVQYKDYSQSLQIINSPVPLMTNTFCHWRFSNPNHKKKEITITGYVRNFKLGLMTLYFQNIVSSYNTNITYGDIDIYFYITGNYNSSVRISIYEPYEPTFDFSISSFNYIYIIYIVIGVIVLAACIGIIVKVCLHLRAMRNTQTNVAVPNSQGFIGNPIVNAPESPYDPNNCKYGQAACTVCSVNFIEDVPIRELPCKHIFHKNCIDTWVSTRLSQTPLCPICNSVIPTCVPTQLMQAPQVMVPAVVYQYPQQPIQPVYLPDGNGQLVNAIQPEAQPIIGTGV